MKRFLGILVAFAICFSNNSAFSREYIQDHAENTDALYRVGSCAKDGAFTATSTSMIGWGVALFIAIAIITGVLSQNKASSTSSSSDSSSSS